MASHERHDVSGQQQLDRLLNSLFKPVINKTSKIRIICPAKSATKFILQIKGQHCNKRFYIMRTNGYFQISRTVRMYHWSEWSQRTEIPMSLENTLKLLDRTHCRQQGTESSPIIFQCKWVSLPLVLNIIWLSQLQLNNHRWYECIGHLNHYNDVIISMMASQIISLTSVYSTVYSSADQRKHQSSASLALVRGIHRWPVNSQHKWPVTRKIFPFDDVIMSQSTGSYNTPKQVQQNPATQQSFRV